MTFGAFGLELLRSRISNRAIGEKYRNKPTDFTRWRKMGASDIIYYCLNRKGLCTNMETNNFFEKTNRDMTISAQALFDQRLKLSPVVFKDLNTDYLKAFYTEYPDEVKLFNNYVVLAIDGSKMEVPNTANCIEKYGLAGNGKSGVARAGISVCFDVLNHYILDGIVDKCNAAEIGMAMRHIEKTNGGSFPYDRIYLMDRNYVSLAFMQYFDMHGLKYLCRLKANSHYKEETSTTSTSDEIINIKHTKDRLQRSRFHNEELFQIAKSKPFTRARLIKYPLDTGEIEYLITNIEDFAYDDIIKLYTSRWGIETAYFSLKQKLQIEKFTSSMQTLIEQDFYSSVLAFNIIQTGKNEAARTIDQTSYKYEMQINENMAVGFVKNELITIMIEPDKEKRLQKYDSMIAKISKYKVPVRDGRKYPMRFKPDNNNSINKLKSF